MSEPIASVMTEEDLLRAVLQLAKMNGWRTAHFRTAQIAGRYQTPVQGDGKGWPDLTLVKAGRIIFAELKSAAGRLEPEQEIWLEMLREVPDAEVHIWRPANLRAIAETLGARVI